MSLPIHSPLTTPRPTTLAQAVVQARFPRNHATAQLEPHREELLRLRQAGESVETLTAGLRLLGTEIGRETMRRWLQRELGQKPARRKRSRHQPNEARSAPALGEKAGQRPEEAGVGSTVIRSMATPDSALPTAPLSHSVRHSSLILPGETPQEALRRRLAALTAAKAAQSGKPAKGESMPPS